MASVQKVVEAAVVNAAQTVEKQLDDELDRLNNLQDDDLEAIRKKRLAQLKKDAEDRAIWKRNGHGTLQTITEKDFFSRAKGTQRMIVILTRTGTSRFAVDFNDHIAKIAQHHLETFFTTLDAEKAPFLCDKFKIRILPSLIFVKDGEIDKIHYGLDQISPTGKFTTEGIEKRLFDFGMLLNTNLADDV